jgi:serine/threonine protein kinase
MKHFISNINKLNNKMLKIVDNYTLTEYLGKGEYGKVYKAFNIDTKIDVAIKMIPLSKFQ